MIYVTGDIHADQARWYYNIHPLLKKGDYLIIAGDFGFGFWNGVFWPEEMFYDWLAEQPYTILVVDGNHEDFNKLMSYPVASWNGGKVHLIRRNLVHLMRGEVYDIEGKFVFTFGGGYSIDKDRRTEGVSWWPQEMPSKAEYRNAEINLKRHDCSVDYIITHTGPLETVTYLSTFHEYGVCKNVLQEQPRDCEKKSVNVSITGLL